MLGRSVSSVLALLLACYLLSSQSALAESSPEQCFADLLQLVNGSFPDAAQMIAATGRRPMDYGLYDQCRNTTQGQYCVLSVSFMGLGQATGLCVPKSCTEKDFMTVLPLIEKQLNFTIPVGENVTVVFSCTPEHRPAFDTAAWIVVSICILLGFLFVVGTTIDGYRMYVKPWLGQLTMRSFFLPPSEDSDYTLIGSDGIQSNDEPEEPKVQPISFESGIGILRCWSGFVNFEKLLFPAVDQKLASLNGVRVMSIFAVILGHTIMYYLGSDNAAFMMEFATNNWTFQLILQAIFAVDTFFFLSGFLVAFLTLKELEKRNGRLSWPLFYFHRFWRLTPTLALVLFLWWKVLPFVGLGPMWKYNMEASVTKPCEGEWWKVLLYIQDVLPDYGDASSCMGWSWYLGNDMVFYVFTPFLVFPFYHSRIAGWILLLLATIACLVITVYYVVHYDYTYYLLSQKSYMAGPMYGRPWIRVSPYLVGIGLGFFFHQFGFKRRLSPFLSQLMLGLCLVGMCALYFTPYDLIHNSTPGGYGEWSEIGNVFYIATSRLSWGVALAGMFYVCATDQGHVLNWFLSHPYWTPLARLTYSTYLIHFVVIVFYDSELTQPLHWSILTASWQFITTTVLSYLLATVIFVTIERPLQNLEKLMLPGSVRNVAPQKIPLSTREPEKYTRLD